MSRTLARLRGIRRVLGLLLHLLAGLWTVYAVFPFLNPARRQQQVQAWAATLLRRCGLAMERRGAPAAPEPGHGLLLVSNHISWLDIPALHALVFCRFVSKSEVRRWPVVGRLASAAHTLYLQRASRRDAHRVLHDMANPEQTALEFREYMQACVLLRGNAFARIVRGYDGQVRELLPLSPENQS